MAWTCPQLPLSRMVRLSLSSARVAKMICVTHGECGLSAAYSEHGQHIGYHAGHQLGGTAVRKGSLVPGLGFMPHGCCRLRPKPANL